MKADDGTEMDDINTEMQMNMVTSHKVELFAWYMLTNHHHCKYWFSSPTTTKFEVIQGITDIIDDISWW